MPLRLLGFAALLLATPGCDLISTNLFESVASDDRAEIEQLTGDFFECDAEVRTLRDRATGTLEAGDCLQTDGSYQDFYAFRLSEPARVDLDLTSREFAPYLFLLEANLATSNPLVEIARDRNEGRDDRASLALDLDAGLYLVYANSVTADEEGDYTLTVDASAEDGATTLPVQARPATGAK